MSFVRLSPVLISSFASRVPLVRKSASPNGRREFLFSFQCIHPLLLGEVWEYEKILPIKISKISLFYSIFISTTPLKARSDKGPPPRNHKGFSRFVRNMFFNHIIHKPIVGYYQRINNIREHNKKERTFLKILSFTNIIGF